MSAKQVKSVKIAKTVQETKTDTGTHRKVTLTKVPSTPKADENQATSQAVVATEAPVVQEEDAETELVILLDKYVVEADFLDEVESQFCDIYPHLLEDADYSPAEILGATYWANLTDVGQRLAILCLKELATDPEVPLVDITCEDCGITSFMTV